jgi:hypothetical protein
MIDFGSLVSDSYNRKARLYPAILVISPIAAAFIAIRPEVIQSNEAWVFAPIAILGSFLLTQLVRDASKKREPYLFNSWGGMPSIVVLRHRTKFIDSTSKARYHSKLLALVSNTSAVSESQEAEDPTGADATYAAWSEYLRNKTRNIQKFRLLFSENINFGFRRNTWGVKFLGVSLSSVALVSAGLVLWLRFEETGEVENFSVGALAVTFFLCVFWVFIVRKDWVKEVAFLYARQLIVSVDELD